MKNHNEESKEVFEAQARIAPILNPTTKEFSKGLYDWAHEVSKPIDFEIAKNNVSKYINSLPDLLEYTRLDGTLKSLSDNDYMNILSLCRRFKNFDFIYAYGRYVGNNEVRFMIRRNDSELPDGANGSENVLDFIAHQREEIVFAETFYGITIPNKFVQQYIKYELEATEKGKAAKKEARTENLLINYFRDQTKIGKAFNIVLV